MYIYVIFKNKSTDSQKQKILPIFLLLVHVQRILASPLSSLSLSHFSLSLCSLLSLSLFSHFHTSSTSDCLALGPFFVVVLLGTQ